MLSSSTHNHTTWCDGKNTPEEMAEAAWKLGFTDLGFSGHTYVDFADFGIRDELAYTAMLRQLGEQFAGRMQIAVGIEHDWYYPVRHREAFDYIIGSVTARLPMPKPAGTKPSAAMALPWPGGSTRSQRKMPSSTVRTSSDILTLL